LREAGGKRGGSRKVRMGSVSDMKFYEKRGEGEVLQINPKDNLGF